MRKGLFVFMLVAAAFAGGTAIHRPELGWTRTLLQIRTVEAGPPDDPAQVPPVQPSDAGPGQTDEIPSAPPPSLIPDARRTEPARAPAPAEAPKARPPSAPASPVSAEPEPVAGPATPEPLDAKALGVEPKRPEESIPSLSTPADSEPTASPVPAPESPGPNPTDPGWADEPASTPAATLARSAGGTDRIDRAVRPAVLAPGPAEAGPSQGWADLRRRMHALGVSRYWVEGEPNGPARFRCVIPLADGHAVGQQFEADGRDDLQAAEAALRRVVLWKATEAPADSPPGP